MRLTITLSSRGRTRVAINDAPPPGQDPRPTPPGPFWIQTEPLPSLPPLDGTRPRRLAYPLLCSQPPWGGAGDAPRVPCSRGGVACHDGVVCCPAKLRRTDEHQTLRSDPASPSAQPSAALPLHLSERDELRERTGHQATLCIAL